jgi:hypothetical protein
MKVGNWEKLRLPLLNPLRPSQALAFGTVAVATTVERIAFEAALIAAFEVAPQRGCAAHLDRGHDAPLHH